MTISSNALAILALASSSTNALWAAGFIGFMAVLCLVASLFALRSPTAPEGYSFAMGFIGLALVIVTVMIVLVGG